MSLRRSPHLAAGRPDRRLLGVLLAALLLLGAVSVAPPALAEEVPVPTAVRRLQTAATLTSRPATGPAGTVFRFRGAGFHANETISTVVRWPDGSEEGDVLFQANAEGVVEFIWDSKGAVNGAFRQTATGAESARVAVTTFTVAP